MDLLVALDQFVVLVRDDDELLHAAAYRQAAFGIALSVFQKVLEEPLLDAGVLDFKAFRAEERKRNDSVVAEQLVVDLQIFETDHALRQRQRLVVHAGDSSLADGDSPHHRFGGGLRIRRALPRNPAHAGPRSSLHPSGPLLNGSSTLRANTTPWAAATPIPLRRSGCAFPRLSSFFLPAEIHSMRRRNSGAKTRCASRTTLDQ